MLKRSAKVLGTPGVFDISDPCLEGFHQCALFLARLHKEQGLRTFVFSGTVVGDGTTTAAIETAEQLRDALQMRPLIVRLDSNERQGRRAKTVKAESNLELLGDETRNVRDCIQSGPHDLPVITGPPINSALTVTRNVDLTLTRLIRDTEGTHDILIVDAPPISSPVTASVCQLIPNVVLVVRAGHARHEVVQHIAKDLEERGVNLVGTILNRHRHVIPNWFYSMFIR